MTIYALTGLIGSGKDTVGQMITEYLPNTIKLSFADCLKDVLSVLFGWDRQKLAGTNSEDRAWREQVDEFWTKKLGKTWSPRIAMQQIGTELFRDKFYANIWVDNMERKLVSNSDKNIVITDARFKNEIELLKQYGAIFIRVERGDKPYFWNDAIILNNDDYDVVPDIGIYTDKQKNIHQLTNGMKDLINGKIHPSEWKWIGIDNPNYIIDNDCGLEELQTYVNIIIDIENKIG